MGQGQYLSTDPNAGTPLRTAAAPKSEPNTVGTLVSHVGAQVNPVTAVGALVNAAAHPVETVKQLGAAQGALYDKAKTAYDQGDYVTAATKFMEYLIPVIGPVLSESGDRMQRGEYAAGAGDALGVGLAMFGPAQLSKIAQAKYPLARNPTPPQTPRDPVVQFAKDQDIPLDAATATGNRFVRGTQKLADESLGGSVVADKAAQVRDAALQRTGERLAGRTGVGPTMPEQAGAAMQTGVEGAVRHLANQADGAYARIQHVTQQVPLTGLKQRMMPLYQALKREAELVPLQGAKARALTALDRLVNGPDAVPLATADAAAGELGQLAGHGDLLRTPGQGVAAHAFGELRNAVDRAAAQAGPDVLKALQEGRQATKAKWAAAEVFESLATEPVRAFQSATWARDAGIAKLREVAKLAPDVLPQIGRAYLDDVLQKATEHGGFKHAAKLATDWDKLGPQTKQLLFADRAYINDLTNFFQLARRFADNPNPSGTALTLWKGGELTGLATAPSVGIPYSLGMAGLSKLLHSQTAVKLLTEGLKLPAASAAAKQWAARAVPVFNGIAEGRGSAVPLAPAAAEDQR